MRKLAELCKVPVKSITLTPQFRKSMFSGYDQVAGTHFFDTARREYDFVARDDYDALLSLARRYELALDRCRQQRNENLMLERATGDQRQKLMEDDDSQLSAILAATDSKSDGGM